MNIIDEKSAGAVIFRKENNVLFYLLLHYEGGHWDFPKGNVEENESERDTMSREVMEETGIKDTTIMDDFKENIRYFYRRSGQLVSKQVIFYIAETETKDVRISHEHKGFVWLPLDKALKQLTFKNAKKLLTRADEFIKKKKSLKDFG